MPGVLIGGIEGADLVEALREALAEAPCTAVGIASAFVSVSGVELAQTVLASAGVERCRLVAGTDYAITHPEALTLSRTLGWSVRLGTSGQGVFHPKLVVGGQGFHRNGSLRQPSALSVGSVNLTRGGLRSNVECALIDSGGPYLQQASDAFGVIWRASREMTAVALKNYAAAFAKINRNRSVASIKALGIADDEELEVDPLGALRQARPPHTPAVSNQFASQVWAELRSFTGEYAFQVEFPRAAGEVLHRFVAGRLSATSKVLVECEDDEVRSMTARFYEDNSMYRLNVPLAVPGVEWARANRRGLALVRRGPEGGAPISLTILRPGNEMDDIVARSKALGTWGATRTRLFGWS